MAGILESLNDRKAYYAELRRKNPEDLVGRMSRSSERLARQVGEGTKNSNQLLNKLVNQDDETENRFREQGAQSRKFHGQSQAQGERTISQVKNLGYELGNDISSMKNSLSGILRELLQSSKRLERTMRDSNGGGGGLLDDLFDRGRRRGRGRGAGRGRGRGGRVGRGGLGRGTRAPSPARPPPIPRQGGGILNSARNAAARAGSSIRGTAGRAAGWARGLLDGGAAGESAAVSRTAGQAARAAAGTSAAAGLLRKAGTAGAIAAGGYQAYQALTDKTKDDGQKAQAVANVAGGTAGALALGAAGAQGGAALGTMIFPGVGTAIGGAVGGLGGGALGYFGGEKIVSEIGEGVSSFVSKSGIGDNIGRATAVALAPFSRDAREAVVSDFKNNIIPGFDQTFTAVKTTVSVLGDQLTGFAGTFTETLGTWKDQLAAQFSKLPEGIQTALKATGSAALAPVRTVVGTGKWLGDKALKGLASTGDTGASIANTVRRAASTAVSALPSGLAGQLGFIAAKYESGGKGVDAVSTGKGDHGGVSYGKHQLATKNGSMAKFLASSQGQKYASQFAGLKPGSAEFNERYKQVVASDRSGMEQAQQSYITATHYNPLAKKIAGDTGLDVNKRGRAVQEAVMSTGVQYGGGTSVFTKALKGIDTSKASDEDIINALQSYKAANVNTHFKSSDANTRAGVAKRIERERADLLAVARNGNKDGAALAASTTTAVPATANKAVVSTASATAPAPAAKAPPVMTKPVVAAVSATPASPVERVRPNTPVESKPVAVISQPEVKPAAQQQKAQGGVAVVKGRSGGGINFEEIPAFVPDPIMAGILFGRA